METHAIAQLEADIRSFIAAAQWLPSSDDAAFEALALRVFAYQWEHNRAYQRFCQRREIAPATVTRWQDIPAVPTTAFKHLALTTFPPEEAATVYYTSGTTQGVEQRGSHYVRDVSLYEAALRPNLAAHLFPDALRMPIYSLFWSARERPHSSLAHMLDDALHQHGSAASRSFLSDSGLDVLGLADALDAAVAAGQPICLLGVQSSFIHFLDWCQTQGRSWQLPVGSRLMDTGGNKGTARPIARDELYGLYGTLLGLASVNCINEYGMTEMSSQFYDGILRAAWMHEWQPRYKVVPPWVRTLIVDPETLEPVERGQLGLLRHYDLANLYSVLALQTEDRGVAVAHGFEVLGRASTAEQRGCSLAVADVLAAQRNGNG